MKKIQRIYFILTYMFFIYPPFIWGLVLVYNDDAFDQSHIISLIINIIVILLIALICYLFIRRQKLHYPNELERKYLIFGFTGNVAVYFYTFQNLMNIENIITIYLILLIVMGVYYFLISRKFRPIELWVLLPIYLVYDYVFLAIRGCGFAQEWNCNINHSGDTFLMVFFGIVVIFTVLYYIYRLISYNLKDYFKVINIIIVTILSIAALFEFDMDEEFLMTLAILYPFFVIVDFIVKIVNKTYIHKMLLFYIRTLTIFIVCTILGVTGFMFGDFDSEVLPIMVVVTYVSLGINILRTLLNIKVDERNPIAMIQGMQSRTLYVVFNREELEDPNDLGQVFQKHANDVLLDENAYNLLCIKENDIVGYISASLERLDIPYEDVLQAYIQVINVVNNDEEVLLGLLERTERHYKSLGIKQINYFVEQSEPFIDYSKFGFLFKELEIHVQREEKNKVGIQYIKKL